MIPYSRQSINEQDIDAVVEVLKSDFLTQGPVVPKFERAVADYCGAQDGIAVNSATSALHIACLALGLGPGDILWTSPNTFVASANCALYCGAQVDFVDIDPRTFNMSLEALQAKLEIAEVHGKLPKIVVPVHFAGQSCQMREIKMLSERYGFKILEDASHAIGGKYLGKPVGSCEYSDVAVFSFHAVKNMTTGEGGMAMTNDTELAGKMRMLRTHGITRDTGRQEGWYYEQQMLGFNYRMTDFQAALGLSQLSRLDQFVSRRFKIVQKYAEYLGDKMQAVIRDSESAWHLYVVRVPNRDSQFKRLQQADLGVNVHYIPVHTQPYYQKLGFKMGDFPQAELYASEALTLPLSQSIDSTKMDLEL